MALSSSTTTASTAERTLEVAERLVQVRGFNGFSYADIAAELHITKASLHYHFPGKAELGEALIARYSARFADALERIDRERTDARAKLEAYVSIYSGVLRAKRMCLCGILAAEYETLPKSMRDAVARFFEDNEAWLTNALAQGRADGSLSFKGTPSDASQMILNGLEGAMLLARTHGGLTRFQSSARQLLDTITP
jgi:TetR/AcrR family transcriptional regulator, transcriptional repressor for nem operon